MDEGSPISTTHHGIQLDDPYAWLRDPAYPTVSDPRILEFLERENRAFEDWARPLQPAIDGIAAELKGRIKEDDASVPVENDGYLYRWRFATGAQYRRWYRQPVGGGDEQLVLDEPALAEGLAYFRLSDLQPSPDGKLLAYAVDTNGSERFTIRVKDVASGALLADVIDETAGGIVWSADGTMLLYARLNPEWRPYQVLAHRLGAEAPPALVYEEQDPGFRVSVHRSQSRELILVSTGDHVTTEVLFAPAADPLATLRQAARRQAGVMNEVDHGGGRLVIRSNDTHRNFRVATATLAAPLEWRELIAGSDRHYIRSVTPFGALMAIEERIEGLDQIRLRDWDGAERYVRFPDAAYEVHLGANPMPAPERLRIVYSALNRPLTEFDADPATGQLATLKVQEIPSGYDANAYTTERLMAPARDGARIPISIVHRRDWQRRRGAPLHLYGYGAYGLGMEPSFSAARVSLLDRGFAYAIAHIRGGDELGRGWYEDGKLERRWNTFNDFIDAARFLIEEGYAEAGSISISGGSAGGQLMGVAANVAPELWRAVVAHVPFVDSLNTMLDGSLPLTPPEWPEWGNPITDEAAFRYILSYSPYENVSAQAYPPMLVTAGLNDPRVTYWEPAKWVAKLRATKTDDHLLLLKTNMTAGHGGRSGRFEALREVAEAYVFILSAFGLVDPA